MKKIIFSVMLLTVGFLSAQNTFDIVWEPGSASGVSNITIEAGDTVKWIWTDLSPKSITALPGGKEIFDSGIIQSGIKSYSYTFFNLGQTRFENEANPAMTGQVTVVRKMSQEEKFVKNISFYPNPVSTVLNISSVFSIDSYEVYNALGTLVLKGRGNSKMVRVNLANLNSGLYFVKIFADNMHTTLKITKS